MRRNYVWKRILQEEKDLYKLEHQAQRYVSDYVRKLDQRKDKFNKNNAVAEKQIEDKMNEFRNQVDSIIKALDKGIKKNLDEEEKYVFEWVKKVFEFLDQEKTSLCCYFHWKLHQALSFSTEKSLESFAACIIGRSLWLWTGRRLFPVHFAETISPKGKICFLIFCNLI